MVLRQILKFHIACDGYHPTKGQQLCGCEITVEGYSRADAEYRAKQHGWREDHRGWLCNAYGGHRDDKST